MKKIILSIDGMTCSACSSGLEKYLNKQNGINVASVNLVMANASIEYDENILNQDTIEKFVQEAGFKSAGIFKEIKEEKKSKKQKVLFFTYLVLAIILMYISMGHMIGMPISDILNMHKNPVIYTITLLVLSILFLIYGFDILKNGYKNLIHKTPNMDTLVGISVLSSFLYSLYNSVMVIKGNYNYVENLYFESAAIVIFFIKLGRYIDSKSKDKTREAIQNLVKITPNHAIIIKDGKELTVTLDEIQKGDIVICRPGEKVAVDGEIIKGNGHFDESFLTGESKPSLKQIGEKVIAGSINYDGYIEYKAEKIGKESTISEIVKLVVEATNTKAPIAKIADKVSGYFVPTVIAIAVISFIVNLITGQDFSEAINTFVTILVVACPCSLGLATPLAIVVSEGVCAQNGILVKKSEILENAQKVNTIVFDKTGTLTYGRLKISEIINYGKMEDKDLLQLVGSIEKKATHPIAKAFTDYLEENKLNIVEVDSFEEITGYGIIGKIDNKEIVLGNKKILDKYHITNKYKEDEEKLAKKQNSIIYVVIDKQINAIIGVNDIVRENSKQVIEKLNKLGVETIMLTGDNEIAANEIAKEIGISNVIANVLPKEKVETIKNIKQDDKFVMMCGDGVNDSPALASSDIGISLHSGTDIAMNSAGVILTKSDLNGVLNLINISNKTIRNIKQNLFWAFIYNILMIQIAVGVFKPIGISINPMIASLAMTISSLTVVLNALRLKRIKVN